MAQEFGVASGYSQLSAGVFIPEIWSVRLLERYYEDYLTSQIVNHDYEGEIKKFGDKVNIRRVPEATVARYYVGMKLAQQVVVDENVEFLIDHGVYFNIPVDEVQRRQADFNFVSELESNASRQFKRYIDQQLLGTLYSDAHADNIVSNLTVYANNLPRMLVDAKTRLDQKYAPVETRWMVIPHNIQNEIMLNPTFVSAEKMGDEKSMIRAGFVGMLYQFRIFASPNLGTSGGYTQVLFGCKTATTFGTQFIMDRETIPNPDTFGRLIRGLQVFGWKTVESTHMGKVGVVLGS